MVKQAVTNETAAKAAQEPAVTPESVVESVRALRALIPNYVQLPVPTVRTLVSVSSLNPEFTQAAIHAVSASETVQATVGQTAEELQAAVEATTRWTMVRDELKATLDGVNSAVLSEEALAGALEIYYAAEKLAKDPEHAHLIPIVEQMRESYRRDYGTDIPERRPAPG